MSEGMPPIKSPREILKEKAERLADDERNVNSLKLGKLKDEFKNKFENKWQQIARKVTSAFRR